MLGCSLHFVGQARAALSICLLPCECKDVVDHRGLAAEWAGDRHDYPAMGDFGVEPQICPARVFIDPLRQHFAVARLDRRIGIAGQQEQGRCVSIGKVDWLGLFGSGPMTECVARGIAGKGEEIIGSCKADNAGDRRSVEAISGQPLRIERGKHGDMGARTMPHDEQALRVATCFLFQFTVGAGNGLRRILDKIRIAMLRGLSVIGDERDETARGESAADKGIAAPVAVAP